MNDTQLMNRALELLEKYDDITPILYDNNEDITAVSVSITHTLLTVGLTSETTNLVKCFVSYCMQWVGMIGIPEPFKG